MVGRIKFLSEKFFGAAAGCKGRFFKEQAGPRRGATSLQLTRDKEARRLPRLMHAHYACGLAAASPRPSLFIKITNPATNRQVLRHHHCWQGLQAAVVEGYAVGICSVDRKSRSFGRTLGFGGLENSWKARLPAARGLTTATALSPSPMPLKRSWRVFMWLAYWR